MSNPIVRVNVSEQIAPTPSKLQKTGAMISQGATTTSPGTKTLLKQKSDLTAVLKGALALTSVTWSGSVATATTAAAHGFETGDTMLITIAGETPSGYNGTFLCTITGTSTFTYPLASNPGSQTVAGVYSVEDVAELTAMVNTFFDQGSQLGVYVLELGNGSIADGVSFLGTWIDANPGVFYSYLVPRYWDANSSYLTFLADFEALDSKTYFFTTTTLQTYQSYTSLMKCVFAMIEAPAYGVWPANVLSAISYSAGVVTGTTTTAHGVSVGQWFSIAGCTPSGYNGTFKALLGTTGSTLKYALASDPGAETVLGTLLASQTSSTGTPATEFGTAAPYFVTLNYAPSSTNRVTPLNLAFLFGVTPYPTPGNAAILSTLNDADINIISTGAAGGISNAILIGGSMLDAKPFNYWYSIDWAQIEGQRAVTAALINGSNNPINPIYYNQDGIKALQQVLGSVMASGISFGLVLNPIKLVTLSAQDLQTALDAGTFDGFTVVNAIPFSSYVADNPDDYAAGIYNGLAVDYTPLRGFESITINITASFFAS